MRCASVAATALLLVSGVARGEETLRLTQEEAVSRALESSPLTLRAARDRDVVAAQKVGAAQLLPANPVASVGAGRRSDHSASVPPAIGPEWNVRLEQMLEIAGQRGMRLREADRALAVARARQRLARIDTRAEARTAYVMLQVARAQAEAAVKRLQLGDQLLRAAEARVRSGAASDVELHLAEVERARLEHERIEAELAAGEAERGLKRLIAVAGETRVEPTTPLGVPPGMVGDLARLIDEALGRREERRVVGATREQVDAAMARLKREVVPNPTLFFDIANQQPGQLYVGGGVALPLPVWRRNQGALAEAQAERRRLEEEDRLLQREIALEVTTALKTLQARQEEATLWSGRIVPSAEANVELVRQGWLGGKFDLFRVVQVTREAADARRRQLEVVGELWRARIELERVTGQIS